MFKVLIQFSGLISKVDNSVYFHFVDIGNEVKEVECFLWGYKPSQQHSLGLYSGSLTLEPTCLPTTPGHHHQIYM